MEAETEQFDQENRTDIDALPVVTVISEEKEQKQTDLIQFKTSLIAPVIYQTHTFQSDRAYLLSMADRTFELPDGSCRKFSLKTLERWVRKYRANGPDGIRTMPRRDLGSSRTLTLVVMVRIVEIIKKVPQIKCTKLLGRLEDESLLEKGTVSVDTIRRFVSKHGLRNPVVCEERIRKSFVVDNTGDLFEADTCYIFKIPDQKGKLKWVYIQGIMDDHSRRILSAVCNMQDSADNFLKTLFKAISIHMIPTRLYVDNGSPYICKQLKDVCNRLGITLIHTRASDGASKGCIERFWLSTVMDTLPDLILDKVNTLEGVQKVVDRFVEKYNNRINRGVHGIPNERYQASLIRKPARKAKSLDWLKEQFLCQKWCHLYNDNVIHFDRNHYRIPDEVVFQIRKAYGEKIPVLYDNSDISGTICVEYNVKKYPLSLDNPSENNNSRRNTGGRKAQLAETAREKENSRKSLAEERAEERYNRRMAGVQQTKAGIKETPLPEAASVNTQDNRLTVDTECPLTVDYTKV